MNILFISVEGVVMLPYHLAILQNLTEVQVLFY